MHVVFQLLLYVVFFFKQKTAYEMRISDWSSDVCSSDLRRRGVLRRAGHVHAWKLGAIGWLSGRWRRRMHAAFRQVLRSNRKGEGAASLQADQGVSHQSGRRRRPCRSLRRRGAVMATPVAILGNGVAGVTTAQALRAARAEARCVGKECGSRWRTRGEQ